MAEDTLYSAPPAKAEKLFAVLTVLVSTGAFMNFMVSGRIQGQNMGMVGMELLWAAIYLVTFALFFGRCRHPGHSLLNVWPLIAVVAFAFASASWSEDPALTLRRAFALGLTLVFGVYFATRFCSKQQLRLLAWAYGICIFFSFFFELLGLNPDVGTAGWYGVFYIKNELGRNMALSALIFLFWAKSEPEHKRLARMGLLASILLMALSRSMTAVVSFGLAVILLPYLQWTLRKTIGWVLAGIVFLIAFGSVLVLYAATHMEQVTGLVGKSAMLTGRIPLWILSVVMALRRPWLGYGFSAFWLADKVYVQRIWDLLKWQPPHAHNGFLEMWLELGLVGVGFFLLGFFYYSWRALQFLRRDRSSAAAWPLVFLLFMFVENLAETAFLATNSIYVILYVAMAIIVCREPIKEPISVALPTAEQHYAGFESC